ncbi:hypothetical protein AeRB84_019283 [Aphanomyces euteiches]|nr:hypothetical protein AeRB84_019283 [Aphanomyces euteiches]
MLSRFMEFRPFILQLEMEEIENLMPSPRQLRALSQLQVVLKEFNSVTMLLQTEDVTIKQVRDCFDFIISEYPDTCRRLSSLAEIVHYPDFESGIVKIQSREESLMSDGEIASVSTMVARACEHENAPAAAGEMSLAERALKRHRRDDTPSVYMDCRFILPTSNLCERFFSIAKHALGDRRGRLLPSNFEAQMFLHENVAYWGIDDVIAALNEHQDDDDELIEDLSDNEP